MKFLDIVDAVVLSALAGTMCFVALFAAALAWRVPWTLLVSVPVVPIVWGLLQAVSGDYAERAVWRDWRRGRTRR